MKYDERDPRASDPIERIAYVQTVMLPDADALAFAFEKFGKENVGNPERHSFYRRMGTCTRDFANHLAHIFATMPESLRASIERSPSPPKVAAPFPSIKT